MTARTTAKKVTLDSLIGKKVKMQQNYKDVPEGPFLVQGIDAGFICLALEQGTVWVNSSIIEVIAEYREPTDDEQ